MFVDGGYICENLAASMIVFNAFLLIKFQTRIIPLKNAILKWRDLQ